MISRVKSLVQEALTPLPIFSGSEKGAFSYQHFNTNPAIETVEPLLPKGIRRPRNYLLNFILSRAFSWPSSPHWRHTGFHQITCLPHAGLMFPGLISSPTFQVYSGEDLHSPFSLPSNFSFVGTHGIPTNGITAVKWCTSGSFHLLLFLSLALERSPSSLWKQGTMIIGCGIAWSPRRDTKTVNQTKVWIVIFKTVCRKIN